MDSPLELSKFDLTNESGIAKFYMAAQAEFYNCITNLENSMPEVSVIIYSFDFQLSSEKKLKILDDLLHKYILSWQTLHLFYQEVLKSRNIESLKYYQDDLYSE